MSTWFTKYPFPGWVALVLLLLLGDVTLYIHNKDQYSSGHLAAKVQADFSSRALRLDEARRQHLFSFPVNQSALYDLNRKFITVFFRDKTPVFWNTNDAPTAALLTLPPDSVQTPRVLQLVHGIFYVQRFALEDSGAYALALIPIAYKYPYAQKYFRSYFVAGPLIPPDISIGNKGLAIRNIDGSVAFHLSIGGKPVNDFKIDGWVGLLTVLLLAGLFIWIHKICVAVSKRNRPFWGWLVLLVFSVTFNLLRTGLGYPLGFENAGFFSPRLLASGSSINSFPDLFFYVFFDFWLYFFLVRYVPVRETLRIKNPAWRYIVHLGLVFFLIQEIFNAQASNVFALIIDSKVSFVVNDFRSLSVYTLLGIVLMCLIVLSAILVISIINDLLAGLFKRSFWHYALLALGGLACIAYLPDNGMPAFYWALLIVTLSGLALVKKIKLPVLSYADDRKSFEGTRMYAWFVILCSWVAIQIFYFNFSKERALRKVYAGRVSQQNAALLDYSFSNLSTGLQDDHLLKTLWQNPSAEAARGINKHIVFHYLGRVFQKFQASFYYYDAEMRPLIAQDTLDKALIRKADSLSGGRMRNGLVALQSSIGRDMYWGMFPVFNDQSRQKIGYVGIDFSMDNSPKRSPTTLFLQLNNDPSDELYFNDYSYAVYKNHKLEAQEGSYTFPFRAYFESSNHVYSFKEHWFYSDLFYQASADELVVVRYQRNLATDIISLFSYVLATWLILSGLLVLLKYFVSPDLSGRRWRRLNLTIRAKVNWTIMVTVFLSLVVVGGITVSFLKSRYQETKHENLRNLMFYFGQNIVHFIEGQKSVTKLEREQRPDQFPELVYLLNTLAGEQGLDINLYNKNGRLMATSQSALLQKGFLSSLMNPVAFDALKEGNQPDWQGIETIGTLDYQSLYLPLRNKGGEIIAYLNLPDYTSQSTLKAELSGILSTLVNIYMLIFFIAGLSALLISNSIVRSFYLLIEQFRKIRLEHNVLIHWPYRDELGLLVNEYNNMILKVERMAAGLANSEREAAWRELALQIAHEIKNPLTPMKLNIQYLKKAVKEGHRDIIGLAGRMSDSLIEQIENLDVIATEFAHFARMPKASPEMLDVSEQLRSLWQLYQKEGVLMTLDIYPPGLSVLMDKGYFIRVFTNLIKNALQAIPDTAAGQIDIKAKLIGERKVRISVSDNGSGIPADLQKRIFTPYFTTKSSGTGIGLAMTKNMVEQSGGSIGFHTKPGAGTEFFVILPLPVA
ncbi:MAG TPA: HAMP domain-containing sensor histidine kinase [Edaphocola sp.]|nr:HAMP domain-containing sensor histidine kinase [Edaphocola sp.]